MSKHSDIKEEVKVAMKARDQVRLDVLRGLLSAFTNEAVAKGGKPDTELPDEDVITVITRAVKQRRDSIEQFTKGGRPELAESEQGELAILESYLPEQMSEEEVRKFVEVKLAELKPDPSGKGQFMGAVMKELKGKAEGAVVKQVIDSLFA